MYGRAYLKIVSVIELHPRPVAVIITGNISVIKKTMKEKEKEKYKITGLLLSVGNNVITFSPCSVAHKKVVNECPLSTNTIAAGCLTFLVGVKSQGMKPGQQDCEAGEESGGVPKGVMQVASDFTCCQHPP